MSQRFAPQTAMLVLILLVDKAIDRFGPIIAAVTDRVMRGTDAAAEWNFEKDIYKRFIESTDHFI